MHGASVTADQVIHSGGYEHVRRAIASALPPSAPQADESRLDLINRNVVLFNVFSRKLKKPTTQGCRDSGGLQPGRYPDLCAAQRLGLPAGQVIGLGTLLDTIRFVV